MARKSDNWSTISMHPLSGPLDLRSNPTEIQPGSWRWKLNIEVTQEGKVKRRAGFGLPYTEMLYDNLGTLISVPDHPGTGVYYHNHDHHHQGVAEREQIIFLHECTRDDGTRFLFDGTQSRLSVLKESTGYWTDLATGQGAYGSRWKAAQLQDTLFFTNDVNDILMLDLATLDDIGTATTSTVNELKNVVNVSAAKIVIQYLGFIILMNIVQDGVRYATRIIWSDQNDGTRWDPASADPDYGETLTGFQDLTYGDDILGAAQMHGNIYIYTRRGIWKMSAASDETVTFIFTQIYSEPLNQKGCLFYPETLVSTGAEHWYMSRDGICRFDPYIPAPEQPDWLDMAAQPIFSMPEYAMNSTQCSLPVACLVPSKEELWFSWPSGTLTANNWTLVANYAQKTADVVDAGFSAFCNYRRTPSGVGLCNEVQSLFGASTTDYCIKEIGQVFYRQYLQMDALTGPIPDPPLNSPDAVFISYGYKSILRGEAPLGFYDREKIIRKVKLDHSASDESVPPVFRFRLGNSEVSVDPNSERASCSPQWWAYENKPIGCPETRSNSQLSASKQRPSRPTQWNTYRKAKHLYFELVIANANGTDPVGGDVEFFKFDFDATAMPKTKL